MHDLLTSGRQSVPPHLKTELLHTRMISQPFLAPPPTTYIGKPSRNLYKIRDSNRNTDTIITDQGF